MLRPASRTSKFTGSRPTAHVSRLNEQSRVKYAPPMTPIRVVESRAFRRSPAPAVGASRRRLCAAAVLPVLAVGRLPFDGTGPLAAAAGV
jgi:hypothetical protein